MERLYTTAEVAEIVRMAPSTIRYWRMTGTGPAGFKLGRRVLYRESALLDWLQERSKGTAA